MKVDASPSLLIVKICLFVWQRIFNNLLHVLVKRSISTEQVGAQDAKKQKPKTFKLNCAVVGNCREVGFEGSFERDEIEQML